MKRKGYLYEKVVDYDNIIAAMEAYDANRPCARRRGVDYRLAWEIKERMERDFAGLVAHPQVKYIRESGKVRRLQVPSYTSCIARLALWNVCGQYVERRIHDQRFSSRRGMGGHLAARRCERFVHFNIDGKAKYHLYFDIRKYYQHIDRRVLKDRLSHIFKDERVLAMFGAVIDSSDEGLPIGYPFSHALANLFLVPLYFLVRSIKGISKVYVYMDNWTVFSRFKKPLHKAAAIAQRWLAGVGCEMKHDWQIAPTRSRGVKLCGFIIGNGPTRLYRRIWHRIMRNVDAIKDTFERLKIEHLTLSLMSRLGWLKAINRQYLPCLCMEKGYLWQ